MDANDASQEEPGAIPIEKVREFLRAMAGRRSIRQLAHDAGVGREAVRKFVQGESLPYSATAEKLREFYVREARVEPGAGQGSVPSRPYPVYRGRRRLPAAPPSPQPSPDPRESEFVRLRLASARRAFSSDAELADVLGVDRAQPGRWRAGQAPDPLNRERIVAIDVVVELLGTWLAPTSIPKWLNGVNAHLGNRRPVQVLRDGGLSEVIAAIESEKGGAYA
jgi:hypothetical protein